MIDYMLKFKDEAEANSVLMDGETPNFRNIDVIGQIEGVSGFHVNVRVIDEDGSVLEDYKVNPEPVTPVRVWC